MLIQNTINWEREREKSTQCLDEEIPVSEKKVQSIFKLISNVIKRTQERRMIEIVTIMSWCGLTEIRINKNQ